MEMRKTEEKKEVKKTEGEGRKRNIGQKGNNTLKWYIHPEGPLKDSPHTLKHSPHTLKDSPYTETRHAYTLEHSTYTMPHFLKRYYF